MANGIGVTIMFSPQVCPTCCVPFMVPEPDLETRRAQGRSLFCPSGHEIRLSASGELADLRWQLEQALGGWKEDRERLTGENLRLNRELAAEKTRSLEVEAVAVKEAVAAELLPPAPAEPDETTETPAGANWRDQVKPKECKECGKEFRPSPKVNTGVWKKQKYCGPKCQLAYNKRVAKERAAEVKKAKTRPSTEAVQDANGEPGGRDAAATDQTSPPALPDQAGTDLPGFFSLRQELASQNITTVEQVAAMTDKELLELPRVSKPKLTQLRLQIAELKAAVLTRVAPTKAGDSDVPSPAQLPAGTEDAAEGKEAASVAETVSLAEPVQDAQDEPSVKQDVQAFDALHLEAPTLTDPAYGGPPAPEIVAEEVDLAPEQVAGQAEQVVGQVEQVDGGNPIGKPRRSVESEPTGSKPGKSKIKALSPRQPEPGESKPDKSEPSKVAEKPSMVAPPPSKQPRLPDPRQPKERFGVSLYEETRPNENANPKPRAVTGIKAGETTVVWRGVLYPARLEELLETTGYPEKLCAWCGEPFTPRLKGDGLESLQYFKMRKTCSDECAKNRASGKTVDQARERRYVKREAEDHIETLDEVRARTGELPPLSEAEEKKLDEQLRRELASAMEAYPELLEEFGNWHAQVERATQAIAAQDPPERKAA